MRVPTLLIRELEAEEMAVRLWNIGSRQKFISVLQRFRSEFLLARHRKIEGLDWMVLQMTQRDQVADWCRRYGLKIEKG